MSIEYAQLHSGYNPEAEAARYINSLDLKSDTDCFILIEPGQGYMIPVLEQKFPTTRIIALHVNDTDIETKLHEQAADCKKFKIIEWRPAMMFYKEKYVTLLSKTVNYIKRFEAEKRTVKTFGARWVKNFFKNLNNLNSVLLYKQTDIPVIITGSGPSLNETIQIIEEAQESCIIIAASSSILALKTNNIIPDLVIATDGGNWALKHLLTMSNEQGAMSNENKMLAVNLCAALPSQCYDTPQLILNDGSLWQNVILHEMQLPSILIPQTGTVTASAVELALQLTSGNIYLAGTDLSIHDMRTHVKPYAFDTLFYEKANRYEPYYSQSFIRSRQMKDGGSLDIYAQWFKEQMEKWPKRVHELARIRRITMTTNKLVVRPNELFKAVPVKKKNGTEILINNLTDDIRKELMPLIGEDIEKWLTTHI